MLGPRGAGSALDQNIRACLVCAFAGLLRTGEICFQDGKAVRFQCVPSRAALSSSPGRVKVILIREAKRSSVAGVAPVCSSPIQFYPGGSLIDPVLELEELTSCDPAQPSAPLFRDPSSNKPLKVSLIRDMVKRIAAAAGLDPSFFGAHSLRFTNLPHPAFQPSLSLIAKALWGVKEGSNTPLPHHRLQYLCRTLLR